MEQLIPGQEMSPELFLDWLQQQEQKYELVDGHATLMAGASQDHNDIVSSGLTEFTIQLRGKPCRPIGSDNAVQIANGNIRYPDFGVDCGQRNGKSMLTNAVTVVVEVLSPSTRFLDFNKKLDEYKSVATIKYILLVEQDAPCVHIYKKELDGLWTTDVSEGLDATITMPELELSLALAALYERIQFPFRPALIGPT